MSVTQSAIDALFAGSPGISGSVGIPKEPAVGAGAAFRRRSADVQRILHLSVALNVTLAECLMPIESILDLHAGSIIEFDKLFDSELSLRVGNREIGTGQAVKVGENFGLRISAVGTVKERIDAMGG